MFKKVISTVLVMAMMVSMGTTVMAGEAESEKTSQTSDDIIQQQLDGFAQLDRELQNTRATRAAYPTRKGVILVTSDGSSGSLVGHAGIIYSKDYTIESFPSMGVAYYDNNWDTRYSTVYGASVLGTTIHEDAAAADEAEGHWGKPYNWIFTGIFKRDSFYCSHLVYSAYLDTTDVDLNQGGGIIFPIDLIQSSNTMTIYTQ